MNKASPSSQPLHSEFSICLMKNLPPGKVGSDTMVKGMGFEPHRLDANPTATFQMDDSVPPFPHL